jgi:hypothetical protein
MDLGVSPSILERELGVHHIDDTIKKENNA